MQGCGRGREGLVGAIDGAHTAGRHQAEVVERPGRQAFDRLGDFDVGKAFAGVFGFGWGKLAVARRFAVFKAVLVPEPSGLTVPFRVAAVGLTPRPLRCSPGQGRFGLDVAATGGFQSDRADRRRFVSAQRRPFGGAFAREFDLGVGVGVEAADVAAQVVGAGDGAFGEGEGGDRGPFFGREQDIGFAFQRVQFQLLGDGGAWRDFAGRPATFSFAAIEFEFGAARAVAAAAWVFERGVGDFGFAVDRAFEAAERGRDGERVAGRFDGGFFGFFELQRFVFVGRALAGAFAVFVFAAGLLVQANQRRRLPVVKAVSGPVVVPSPLFAVSRK